MRTTHTMAALSAAVVLLGIGCRTADRPQADGSQPALRATYLVVQTSTNRQVSHPSGFWSSNVATIYGLLTNAPYNLGAGGGTGTSAVSSVFGRIGDITAESADYAGIYAEPGDVTSAVGDHESDTTSVHGIADTSVLLTSTSTLDDDRVAFDDGDNLWSATTLGAALEELNDSINGGVPNGSGSKLHWSQLTGVPAGFADGTDDEGDGGGGGGVTLVDGAVVTNANFVSNWRTRRAVTSVTNVVDLPPFPISALGSSFTPDFSASTFFDFELTGATTINAPTNVSTNMIGAEFLIQLAQDATGNRTATWATNYMGATTLPIPQTLSTNGVDILRFLVVRADVFRLTMHHSGYAK